MHISKEDLLQRIDESISNEIVKSKLDIIPTCCEEDEKWLFREEYSIYGIMKDIDEFIENINKIEYVTAHDDFEDEDKIKKMNEDVNKTVCIKIDLQI